MSRHKPKPDTRPRWYDDLKVYYSGKWYNAEEYRLLCERYINLPNFTTPNYKDDPSYHWREKIK